MQLAKVGGGMERATTSGEGRHTRSVGTRSPSPARHGRHLAMQLLKDEIGTLGKRYAYYVVAVIGFGLVTLLPPQLFRFFTEGTQQLSSLNAQEFLVKLAVFGA